MNKNLVFTDIVEIIKDIEELKKQVEHGIIRNTLLSGTLTNLRSILEHTVKDAATFYGYKGDIYFPYGQRKNHFKSSIGRTQLKNIKNDNPAIYELLESIQPYRTGDNWVVDLFHLTNRAKHESHNPVSPAVGKSLNYGGLFSFEDCSNVSVRGFKINGKEMPEVHIHDNDNFTVKGPNKHLFTVTEGKKMSFEGKELEIDTFLYHTHEEISNFVTTFYEHLK